jgi:hypothetical protein
MVVELGNVFSIEALTEKLSVIISTSASDDTKKLEIIKKHKDVINVSEVNLGK